MKLFGSHLERSPVMGTAKDRTRLFSCSGLKFARVRGDRAGNLYACARARGSLFHRPRLHG